MRNWINLFEMSAGEARAVFSQLGVNTQSLTPEEFKKTYRQLMMKNHPDTGGDEEVAKNISAAYDVLKDRPQSYEEPADKAVKEDFHNIDYVKQWFAEQSSGKPSQQWTVMNFDGSFFRGMFTVSANHEMFSDMARIMRIWDRFYPCRAIMIGTRSMLEQGTLAVIWCDGHEIKPMITLSFDSFNLNPSNDSQFSRRLPSILDSITDGTFTQQLD